MQTRKFIQTATYPIVSANVVGADGELLTPKPYVILNVNGLRIAVIGAMTDALSSLTIPKAIAPWHTLPVIETARKYARELKSQERPDRPPGAHHHARGAEVPGNRDRDSRAGDRPRAQRSPPAIDAGRAHHGARQRLRRGTRAASSSRSTPKRSSVVSWDWKHIPINSLDVKPAADVAKVVKHWEDQVSARVDQPLAVSERAFDKRGVKSADRAGHARTDRRRFRLHEPRRCPRRHPPGSALRSATSGTIMPFDNHVVFGKFKGRELPAVVLGDRKVEPDREYTLAVTDFTAANQGTAENLRVTGLDFPGDGGLLRDVLVDWFRKKKVIQ